MEGIPVPVTLIVKASNQQFEDQTIKCELSWTISKLKGYLSEVYPSKPSRDEQKLIYSGQLLHDAIVLKDILRQYDGQETHTVHLVFTPKGNQYSSTKKVSNNNNNNMQPNRSTTTTRTISGNFPESANALRQRNVHSANNTNQPVQNNNTTQTQPIPVTTTTTNYPNTNFTYNAAQATTTPMNNEYIMAQQMAMQNWMQQAYMQYMNQYMTFLSSGVRPENIYVPQSPQQQQNITHLPNMQNTAYMQQYFTPASSQPLGQVSADATSNTQIPQPPAPQPQGPDAGAGVVQAPNENRAERRFPNLINDEQENRDWLDIFYAFTRLCILLTVIYFYSSPIRCLIVICIGIAIYLYQLGIFRNLRPQPVNNNNNNNNAVNNNVVPIEAANNNINNNENNINHEDNVNENDENNVNNENPNEQQQLIPNTVNNNNTEEPRNENEGAVSMIEGIRTLFFSFFASIIPEAPAL